MTAHWHIVTPELPPTCGGVGDYVAQLAPALAAATRERVTVWAPAVGTDVPPLQGVEIVQLPDRFGARSRALLQQRLASEPAGSRLLVQYVGNVFGMRGANVPFCRWLAERARAGQDVRVMVHEPYLYLTWRPDHLVVALAQRLMARELIRAASRVYLSTATWKRYLSRFSDTGLQSAIVLPIPSGIPCVSEPARVKAARQAALKGSSFLVGHFGTYGTHIAPVLERTLVTLLRQAPGATALCLGARSDAFVAAVRGREPWLSDRLTARGWQSADDVSVGLQACDVLVQPYPDGVTTRRTTTLAGLANGVAVVTTRGALTEDVWIESGAVAFARAGDAGGLAATTRDLLGARRRRQDLATRGRALYDERFDLRHTVAALTT